MLRLNLHVKGEEKIEPTEKLYADFIVSAAVLCTNAKMGDSALSWENAENHSYFRGIPGLSGKVQGPDFELRVINWYGDNPMYYYESQQGTIYAQQSALLNSSVTLDDTNDTKYTGIETLDSEAAVEFLTSVTTRLRSDEFSPETKGNRKSLSL